MAYNESVFADVAENSAGSEDNKSQIPSPKVQIYNLLPNIVGSAGTKDKKGTKAE
ncbi:hypothetical protein [Parasediminibacterium sp. JCM 36343]|uniref:hypothetical protein n=1 Tax=Parasediminibacterium sp. JCM 36343 TaxID=3374279 RepID=UPI00397C7B45